MWAAQAHRIVFKRSNNRKWLDRTNCQARVCQMSSFTITCQSLTERDGVPLQAICKMHPYLLLDCIQHASILLAGGSEVEEGQGGCTPAGKSQI